MSAGAMPTARASVSRAAPAKVNLALHVTGRRADGYHELDTLVGFADFGDRIEAEAQSGFLLEISGPFARALPGPGGDNLVLRAAEALARDALAAGHAAPGARLVLEKNLPVASGVGGGSADAAATLLALADLWDLPAGFNLKRIAVQLGADIAMCLASAPLRARGIGEDIAVLAAASAQWAVLVNPGVAVSTPSVFAALEDKQNAPLPELPADAFDPRFLATLRNDLQAPAVALQPVIAETLALVADLPGCRLARMSGSGATCFGLFDDREAATMAHRRIVDTTPQWWSVPTRIGGTA